MPIEYLSGRNLQGFLWVILLPLAGSHPRENKGLFIPERIIFEEPSGSRSLSSLQYLRDVPSEVEAGLREKS